MLFITNEHFKSVTLMRCARMPRHCNDIKHSIQLNQAKVKSLRLSSQSVSHHNHTDSYLSTDDQSIEQLNEQSNEQSNEQMNKLCKDCFVINPVSSTNSMTNCEIISIGSIDDTLETLINRSINNTAITKWFDRIALEYNNPITPSRSTYRGMYKNLITLTKQLLDQGIDPMNYYVLCPHYRPGVGDDTQAGGGGKATKFLNKKTLTYHYESFDLAVREEMREELRITGGTPRHMSRVFSTRYKNHKNGDRDELNIETNIYAFNVSECEVDDNFDTTYYNKKKQRGKNDPARIVGYIVWGKREDCIDLVSQIRTICPINVDGVTMTPNQIDDIDAISIISLPKTISMARYADENFTGLDTVCTYI